AATDGVHSRQVRRRAADRVVDAVEMILRIALYRGTPCHFLAEHYFAVHHRRALAIASAQVKPDAATLHIPPSRPRRLASLGRRPVGPRSKAHPAPINPPSNEIEIKSARPPGRIAPAEIASDPRIARDGPPVPAPLPQQKLEQPLDILFGALF